MKTLALLITAIFLVTQFCSAQESNDVKISTISSSYWTFYSITGENVLPYIDSLFAQFSNKKKRGYVWKFKNVQIPGISNPVTFQIHQGIRGAKEKDSCSTSNCGGGSYFHTFTSETYKETLLSRKKENEKDALIVYIKRGRFYGLKSKEDAEIAKTYLESIYSNS